MARLRIYHLVRTTDLPRECDTLDAIVVAALDETEARICASHQAKDEKPRTWLAPESATCTQVGNALPAIEDGAVICVDTTGF